jgi:hypothetical protein
MIGRVSEGVKNILLLMYIHIWCIYTVGLVDHGHAHASSYRLDGFDARMDKYNNDMADAEKQDKAFPPTGSEPKPLVGQVTEEVVLSKDGLKLFPQPVLGDDLDPLNWSSAQKHTILAIVMSL